MSLYLVSLIFKSMVQKWLSQSMTWGENQQDQNIVLRLCIVYVLVDQICWSFPVDHCEIGYKNENDDDDNIAATDDAFEITSKWRIHSINQENLWSPFFIFLQKAIHESLFAYAS